MANSAAVDEYLAALPAEQRGLLSHLRDRIRNLAPDAEESITYGMPTFRLRGRPLLLYAAWKKHCSLYGLSDDFVAANADELKPYAGTKGSLHFTSDNPFPDGLLARMVASRVVELGNGPQDARGIVGE